MKRRQLISLCLAFLCTLLVTVSCGAAPKSDSAADSGSAPTEPTKAIVIGYSNWAGWWPWAIAEQEGLFAANNVNVEMKWFDGYIESMEAFATGQLDGNCQTLNDTISFAADAINGEVAVLVNDNSAGNDKIIVTAEINTVADLKGKKVAVEEGVVDDFLLSLALEKEGLSRDDVEIVPLETGAAAAAFAAGQVDAVGAFPPFWLTALEREGSKELVTSADFPGAIPDLLVMSKTIIDQRPEDVQAIVKTWFDVLAFMEENPEKADEIMAKRAGVPLEELQQLKVGTRFFTIEDNLKAFSDGEGMEHMPYAAKEMADFMVGVGFIPEAPELAPILDDQFVKAYAAANP
ncbi:MAG: aliphatic sulfonates ABC transporter substrate-binding protein [Phormidesmis priestleyi]|uniref:Aliphatic sulfonates ABC transporter substrate-binding protein n=1 Tax=Phormidesmis priestleyi TaxID=268141 RepID=A0A2W4ZRB8_9CYAN|nr:MAG: aliphatic sulfonates ABC transporter substrate-binding protein [Phormidesmis priestleyi]